MVNNIKNNYTNIIHMQIDIDNNNSSILHFEKSLTFYTRTFYVIISLSLILLAIIIKFLRKRYGIQLERV